MSSTAVDLDRARRSETAHGASTATEAVSIVIPAYNEENGAGPVFEELLQVLEREVGPAIDDWEVIVVDDGSTDRTCEVIERFVGERVRLVRHDSNRGYGAAIKTGIRHARHGWVMITDADGTYPSSHIPDILAGREAHAMVVGARTGERAHVPLLRRPPKWVLRKLASYLSGRDIPDLNSGLRAFRKDLADKFINILPDQFSYTTTITLVIFAAGYDVRYIPINYERREGKSKIRPFADTLNFLRLIVRTMLYFDPLRVFLPIAFLFIVAAGVVAVTSWALTGKIMDVTTVLLFVTGVHMLALGMIADMLNRRLS